MEGAQAMLSQSFVLPKNGTRERPVDRITRVLKALPSDRTWRVLVEEFKGKRTEQQNKYLWAIYGDILLSGGEELGGWTKEDLHEFFLGSHFGWQTFAGFGYKRMKPLKRSSHLTKLEFSKYVGFIQRFMSDRGVYIADPGEMAA